MTVQIAVKLPELLVERVDSLVADGTFASRSQLVRRGIELALVSAHRDKIDRAFEEGYKRHPETEQDLADARRLAVESIEEEPWERWW